MAKKQSVQMSFNPDTVNKVENLKELLDEDNKAQLVAEGISVYLELTKACKAGKKILLEDKEGSLELLVLSRLAED